MASAKAMRDGSSAKPREGKRRTKRNASRRFKPLGKISLFGLLSRAVLGFPEGVCVTDPKGRIQFANHALEALLGYGPSELLGSPVSRLYPDGTDDPVLQEIMESLHAGDWSGEADLLTKEGSAVPTLQTARPMLDEAGKLVGYVCTHRDIRGRKEREEKLQKSEERYRHLYENAPLCDFSSDMSGRITDANKSAVELLGYARDDLIGRSVIDLYADTPAGKEKARRIVQRTRTEEVSGEEMEMRRADGSSVWVSLTVQLVRDAQGQPIGRRGLVLDVTARKRAEGALRESEERYRVVVENMGDAMAINIGRKRVFVNPAFLTLLGLHDRSEAEGYSVDRFVVPEDRARLRKRLAAVERGEPVPVLDEVRVRRADGEVRTVEIGGTDIVYQGQKARLAVLRDVTERKRVEEALAYQAHMVEDVSDALIASDERFVTTVWNRAAEKLYGWTADEAIGRPTAELLQPEFVGVEPEEVFRRLFEEGHFEGEVIHPRKDGTRIHTEARAMALRDKDGHITGFVSIDRDIAPRKRTEDQLRLRTEELEALFKVASLLAEPGAFEDKATRVLEELVTVSQSDSAHLRAPDESESGLRLVASAGLGVREIAPDAVRPFGESRSGTVFTQGEPIIVNDYATNRTDGRASGRALDAYGAQSAVWLPVKAAGRTVGVIAVNTRKVNHFTPERVRLLAAIAREIGIFLERARLQEERGRALEQLQLTQQQLVQSGKLAAIGELVAGVAHEINNPLTGMLGLTELLLRGELDAATKGSLEMVYSETLRVARIVKNLLSFARAQPPQTLRLSINEAVTRTLELRHYDLSVNNIELITDLDPGDPAVLGDLQQLEQVFLNIVNNAQQAMAATNGRGRLEVKTRRTGNSFRVTFTDDGPGIPADVIDRIFDPFFSTKEVGTGTGLGLSICYGIVAEHGGSIWVESPRGKGSAFTVELPLAKVDSIPSAAEAARDGGPR